MGSHFHNPVLPEKLARLTLASCRAILGLGEDPLHYVLEPQGARASVKSAVDFLAAQPKPVEILASLHGRDIIVHQQSVTEAAVLEFLARRSHETREYLRERYLERTTEDVDIGVLVRASSYSELISLRDYVTWIGEYYVRDMGSSVTGAASDPDAQRMGAAFVAELSGKDPSASIGHVRLSLGW